MAFESLQSIIDACTAEKKSFWEIVLEDDCRERNVTKEASFAQMKKTWEAILEADASYRGDRISPSGLIGGDGQRMMEYLKTQKDKTLCGSFLGNVIADALKMGESNACMKRIVAAPTAGACGVLPAVLVPYYRQICNNTDKIIQSLYVAAGIGQVIAERASISGAAGGCQAEIGTASSMAAGALVALQGGDAQAIAHAAAISMKNLLGLVCDPVAGLVEVPCVKRNVIGAVNALSCAEMALAGITSRIPPDQVFDAMKEIGDKMDSSLRETAMGGLAATPAGMDISKEFAKKTCCTNETK